MTKWVYFVNEGARRRSGARSEGDGAGESEGEDGTASFLHRSGLLAEIANTDEATTLGYACSVDGDDHTTAQGPALTAVSCDYVFEDVVAATGSRRSGLNALLSIAKAGDSIVVWRLNRLGLTLLQLIELIVDLHARNVNLQALDEKVAIAADEELLPFSLLEHLTLFERARISEATKAGMQAAQAKGRQPGRPRSLTDAQVEQAQKAVLVDGEPIAAVAARFGVHQRTLYRLVRATRPSGGSEA